MDNKISVSPSLIMSREKTRASSLLAPSGAYLAWCEILKDEDNENKEEQDNEPRTI